MKIYIIWLIGVILWNFGFPNAAPIADVIVAIILSFLSIGLKKYLKLKLITRKINILKISYGFHFRIVCIRHNC